MKTTDKDVSFKKKTRRSKKKTPIAEGSLDPAEAARRDAQKQIQQLTMRLRAEKKSEEHIRNRTWSLKKELAAKQRPSEEWKAAKDYWKEQKAGNAETKKQLGSTTDAVKSGAPDLNGKSVEVEKDGGLNEQADEARLEAELAENAKHDIVIIPIVWRGRHDRQQLIDAAERVKKTLIQATHGSSVAEEERLNVWIDSRRHHTPGQKFAFWEHKGCKFRIEIGPKDLERGQCCLCRHPEKPGDYLNTVKKWASLEDSREILVELLKLGVEKLSSVIRLDSFEDKEGTVMERIENKIDYSAMYDRENEVGGTVADYTKRFSTEGGLEEKERTRFLSKKDKRDMQYGGGGIVKPTGMDGTVVPEEKGGLKVPKVESGDGAEENFELAKPKEKKLKKADYGKTKKVRKS